MRFLQPSRGTRPFVRYERCNVVFCFLFCSRAFHIVSRVRRREGPFGSSQLLYYCTITAVVTKPAPLAPPSMSLTHVPLSSLARNSTHESGETKFHSAMSPSNHPLHWAQRANEWPMARRAKIQPSESFLHVQKRTPLLITDLALAWTLPALSR